MSDPITRLNAALSGRYTIERELGEGGMAKVYLAADLKHERKVALKVLKPELAAVVGADRFLAEIKTTANLQHPHILPLFDSGEAEGFLFYVMPYIEGETLRERIDREKQLTLSDAVRISSDVADALDYAHRHGVIHRDVKPANILLHEGRPVVADFGIALAVSAAGGDRLTETGLSVGTPYYMSPEQASGDREIVAASDVYSLGCVLYEMLTGDPPYTASTAQGLLARILTSRLVRPIELRSAVPENVDAAVARALERVPADRFDTAEAFRAALANPDFRHGAEGASQATPATPYLQLLGVLASLVVLLTGLLGWAVFARGLAEPEPVSRYVISLSDGLRSDSEGGSSVTVSPDGEQMVFVGTAATGQTRQLYLRQRDQLSSIPLPGTEDALSPVFSPDGQRVAFITPSPGTLKVIVLDGEGAVSWAGPLGESRGIAWGSDGYLYVGGREGLRRVPEGGGEPELVTTVDVANNERRHIYPSALPDGVGVVFAVLYTPSEEVANHEIWVLDFATGERKRIAPGLGGRYLSSGHLAYVTTEGTLLAQAFDLGTLELTGNEIPSAEGVGVGPYGVVDMAVSERGDLMYRTGTAGQGELVRVARDGSSVSIDPVWREDFRTLAISPDGRRLAVEVGGLPSTDIWLKTIGDATPVKFTIEGDWNARPQWSPDGESIAFISRRAGNADVWVRPADQSALASRIVDLERGVFEPQWSPDGEALVIRTVSNDPGSGDVLMIRPGEDAEPIELIASEAQEWGPVLSPNGRWLAYTSDETGQFEVYVVPFPDVQGSKVAISSPNGGREVMWGHSGRELFYRSGAGDMISVDVETASNFVQAAHRPLFSTTGYRTVGGHQGYVVAPDDQSFIMIRMAGFGDVAELVVVENWFSELSGRGGN